MIIKVSSLPTLGFSDPDAAAELESKWKKAIEAHGGIHSKGLHSCEGYVYMYKGQGVYTIYYE